MAHDYDDMVSGYDDVEAAEVVDDGALPTGWYPLRVEKVIDRRVNDKSGVPWVRIQLRVTDGPSKNRVAFVMKTMGAGRYRWENGLEKQRTEQEYQDASGNVKAQMKRYLKALGVNTGAPTGDGADKVFNFYNVDDWEGKEFVGRVRIRAGGPRKDGKPGNYPDGNDLAAEANLDDPKHGIAWWQQKHGAVAAKGEAVTL